MHNITSDVSATFFFKNQLVPIIWGWVQKNMGVGPSIFFEKPVSTRWVLTGIWVGPQNFILKPVSTDGY